MSEFLLELLSEEIPARMQAGGAEALSRSFAAAAAPLLDGTPRPFHGPRRIGLSASLRAEVTTEGREERGPRTAAPPAALDGFLRKHGAAREQLVEQNGFWVLQKPGETVTAAALLAGVLPDLIRKLGWPKSMRWNGPFTWVRPLHRILCLLDGEVVPFAIEELPGMESGNLTEGHRIMAAGDRVFAVTGLADYEAGLRARFVEPDAAARMAAIEDGFARLAAAQGIAVVPDRGLLEEVAGLVEWPVPLLGRIDDTFMDLPPELMRTTMRVNQRYFSFTKPDGGAAPFFGIVANIAATDGGAALIAGNERVLRARLSDARFFWDQDRKQRLEDFLPKLNDVVFHAKLGTQASRIARIVRLARHLAPLVGADVELAARTAQLAKADLASGLVGEFPELQGIIGRYYALHQGEDFRVAEAIAAHHRPLGPGDAVPDEPVAIAVALADKLDMLAGFFAAGEKPTGSGDPFALRRAALGVIRTIRENALRLPLFKMLAEGVRGHLEGLAANHYRSLSSATGFGASDSRYDTARLSHDIDGPLCIAFDFDGLASRVIAARDSVDVSDLRKIPARAALAMAFSARMFNEDESMIADLRARSLAGVRLEFERDTAEEKARRATHILHAVTDDHIDPSDRYLARRHYARACEAVTSGIFSEICSQVIDFLTERLRVQLRAEGARHDVVAATFGAGGEDDLVRLLARADALKALVEGADGPNLLAAYKRAANILRIEEKKDGPHRGEVDASLLTAPEEQALAAALDAAEPAVAAALDSENFAAAMSALAALRAPLDAFFDKVIVNDPDKAIRENRLRLLARLRGAMDAVADFSRIEG